MTDCNFLKDCPFFNDKLKSMPTASDMMKKMYCRWHYKKCARYTIAVALGRDKVPEDMFPGDSLRASEMLIQCNLK